jgi:hypothetical protein
VAAANKDLLAKGAQAVRETMARISDRPDEGDRYGFETATAAPERRALVFDEAM